MPGVRFLFVQLLMRVCQTASSLWVGFTVTYSLHVDASYFQLSTDVYCPCPMRWRIQNAPSERMWMCQFVSCATYCPLSRGPELHKILHSAHKEPIWGILLSHVEWLKAANRFIYASRVWGTRRKGWRGSDESGDQRRGKVYSYVECFLWFLSGPTRF